MVLRIKLYSPANSLLSFSFPQSCADGLVRIGAATERPKKGKRTTTSSVLEFTSHITPALCSALHLTPGPCYVFRLEPKDLTFYQKMPSCITQATRTKKITREAIQTPPHSSPGRPWLHSLLRAECAEPSCVTPSAGSLGSLPPPTLCLHGHQLKTLQGSRNAQSICNESTIPVEKKVPISFCRGRNEVIPPPILVGRSEVIPQRRQKITPCTLGAVPWRCRIVGGFARFEI